MVSILWWRIPAISRSKRLDEESAMYDTGGERTLCA